MAIDQQSTWFALKRTVEPTGWVLSLPEAATYLRTNQQNSDLQRVVRAAQGWIEKHTRRQLTTATWRLSLEDFPRDGCRSIFSPYMDGVIYLPRPQLQEIESVRYADPTTGNMTTLSASLYQTDSDSEPGRLAPAFGTTWPTVRRQMNAVQITYLAGYGDDDTSVPNDIKQAATMLAAHWWINREAVTLGVVSADLKMPVKDLLANYRIISPR